MCQEVFQMIKDMNHNELETQLVLQCSPVLMKLKISNLLIVHKSNREKVLSLFLETDITSYLIHECEEKATFLLYRRDDLEYYLRGDRVNELFSLLGYQEKSLIDILREFSKRYSIYKSKKGSFPHEMGLLLGYPVDDVIGFIENQGQNYLYTGYWKVYSNLSNTMQLFEQYNQAKEKVVQMITQGLSVQNIINFN